jgi:hypothetical protein
LSILKLLVSIFLAALVNTVAAAQTTSSPSQATVAQTPSVTAKRMPAVAPNTAANTATTKPSAIDKQDARRKFVLDVVHSAVGLPQPDPQDRLRVLYAAASVVAPIDPRMAQQFAKEGTGIETKLVAEGQRPAVSMLAGGHVDCASALTFVQTIPPAAVLDAEQSLLGAITTCPKAVNDAAERKLEAGLDQGAVAGRPILALMDANGMTSPWSQAIFAKLFASLPAEAATYSKEAPNYAAMFARAAPSMEKEPVKTAGTKFLLWLAKLPDAPERQVAVNMTTGTLSDVLGKDAYQELLRSDVMVQQAANSAGQSAAIPPPEEESVSVLHAMGNTADRTDELQSMTPSLRAREAAASGFASGTAGDRKMADHYFDIAFSSVNQVWSDRTAASSSAPAVVEEVSEAAAQVDPVAALQRSQRLQDPSAEAISMLAVARVVVGKE